MKLRTVRSAIKDASRAIDAEKDHSRSEARASSLGGQPAETHRWSSFLPARFMEKCRVRVSDRRKIAGGCG